jgi:hypothetical protein
MRHIIEPVLVTDKAHAKADRCVSTAREARSGTAPALREAMSSPGSLRLVRLAPILVLAIFSMTVCFLVACGAMSEDTDSTDDELCGSYGYASGKCHGYGGYNGYGYY